MNTLILATRDEKIAQHLHGAVHGYHNIQRVHDHAELQQKAPFSQRRLLLIDPRFFSGRDALENYLKQAQHHTIIILSHPDESDHRLSNLPTISTFMSPTAGLSEIRTLLRLATHTHAEKNQPHRTPRQTTQHQENLLHTQNPHTPPINIAHFLRAIRHHSNKKNLLEKTLDALVTATGVTRIGLVLQNTSTRTFHIQGHRHAPPSSLDTQWDLNDPFLRHLEQAAVPLLKHQLSDNLSNEIYAAAIHTFSLTAADIIIPTLRAGTLIGWIFLGAKATGAPFTPQDLSDLSTMADHLILLIENTQLKQDLTTQKALAETLMECQTTGIISCDSKGTIHGYNHAAEHCLKTPATAILGHNKKNLNAPIPALLSSALEQNQTNNSTSWNLGQHTNHYTATAHRLEDKKGNVLGAVTFITDHTAQKQQIDKKEEIKFLQFLKDLAISMTHELYNPLTPILAFTSLLEEKHNDPEFRKKFIHHTNNSIEKIKFLVSKIQELSATPDANFSTQEIAPYINHGKEYAHTLATNRPLTIQSTQEKNLPTIELNASTLQQVLEHLILNALEAMDTQPDQRLRLVARESLLPDGTKGLSITISDNGPGIPDNEKEQLFSPFFSTKARGIGMGLPIAQRILKEHHGHLNIDSSPNGTTITLLLPLKQKN